MAVKLIVPPTHTGPALFAVGAAGIGFTVIFVVATGLVQLFTVAVTL